MTNIVNTDFHKNNGTNSTTNATTISNKKISSITNALVSRRGMAFLSIVMTLLIVGIIYYFMLRTNKQNTDHATQSIIKDAGIDTSSYRNILDSTKKVIKDAENSRAQYP